MRAKKSYGQHFLRDGRVLHTIVAALEIQENELVCEIGPGTGRLTKRLVAIAGVEQMLCIEMDREMVAYCNERFPGLEIVREDAARVDWPALVGERRAVVCGNLPYNASSPIYFHLLSHRRLFRRLVLMFQREVAQRLLATHGSKRFGPPSVLTTLLSDASKVTHVPPSAFRPQPRVDSTVIQVDPLPSPRFGVGEDEVPSLQAFLKAAFKQRRKTISNNLKAEYGPECVEAISAAGVNQSARAEALPVESLVTLWRLVVGNPS